MKREQCKTPNCKSFALYKGLCKSCYNKMMDFPSLMSLSILAHQNMDLKISEGGFLKWVKRS